MITIPRNNYTLLLSYCPCEVFSYFKVKEMHGLNLEDCQKHLNTTESAYIAGWCNFTPEGGRYVYINLSRCTNDIRTFGLIIHELMHQSMWVHDYDVDKEEEIITWAEEESYKVFDVVKKLLKDELPYRRLKRNIILNPEE